MNGGDSETCDLACGPLSLVFERASGMVRYVRLGEREILRGIYAAIRDQDWNTIPCAIENLQIDQRESSFEVRFDAVCNSQGIKFLWQGEITGKASGTLCYSFRGQALSTFKKNRIGLCVLHPRNECVDCPCEIEHLDGTIEQARFPRWIAPHQPFKDICGISHQVTGDVWARVCLAGEGFEMEDQRNWTDASFKTYSTPLALPFPVELASGARVEQRVELSLERRGVNFEALQQTKVSKPCLELQWSSLRARPGLGTQLGEFSSSSVASALAAVREMGLDHVRIEVRCLEIGWQEQLQVALQTADSIGAEVELAVHATAEATAQWSELESLLTACPARVARVLLFDSQAKATRQALMDMAVPQLERCLPAVPLVVGTDAYFAELNRNRPRLLSAMMTGYSINPQVHASDKQSIVETLEALRDTVDSAVHYFGSDVVISPVTLKPRFNPNRTSGVGGHASDLREAIDNRQTTSFAAAWLVGVLSQLATHPSVASLTLFETIGARGIMDDAGLSYPCGRWLKYLLECKAFCFAQSSDVKQVVGLGCESMQGRQVLLANLTGGPLEVQVISADRLSIDVSLAAESAELVDLRSTAHA